MASPSSPQDSYSKFGNSIIARSKSLRSRRDSGSGGPAAAQITPQSLPSDILIARFQDIKHVAKGLARFFESIVELEETCAKSLTNSSTILNSVIPLESSFQFLPNESKGLQDVCVDIRDRTRQMSALHTSLAKSVESSVIEPLKKVRLDIKAHIKSIENGIKKLEREAEKEREASHLAIQELNKSLSLAQSQSSALNVANDPFVINRQAYRQLKKQIRAENDLHKATVVTQQTSKTFEEDVITQIKRTWSNFEQWSSQSRLSISSDWGSLNEIVQSLKPDGEWNHFSSIPGTLLDPNAKQREFSEISYPGQTDGLVSVVKKGYLKRKKRWTKMETEGLWILSASGFLHEVPKGDDDEDPVLSLYLPNVTLGPLHSTPQSKEHGFYIEGKQEATGNMERAMKSKMGRMGITKDIEYIFMASSHHEAESWWQTIKQHARECYQTKDQVQAEVMAATVSSQGSGGEQQPSGLTSADTNEMGVLASSSPKGGTYSSPNARKSSLDGATQPVHAATISSHPSQYRTDSPPTIPPRRAATTVKIDTSVMGKDFSNKEEKSPFERSSSLDKRPIATSPVDHKDTGLAANASGGSANATTPNNNGSYFAERFDL